MCNQCNDYRAIHDKKTVFGIFHNSKMILVNSSLTNAERSINVLKGSWCNCAEDDECRYEIYEIDRRDVTWETR